MNYKKIFFENKVVSIVEEKPDPAAELLRFWIWLFYRVQGCNPCSSKSPRSSPQADYIGGYLLDALRAVKEITSREFWKNEKTIGNLSRISDIARLSQKKKREGI